MPLFKPLHTSHSVRSVVVRATGSGHMLEEERPRLRQKYVKGWQAILPAEQVHQQVQITLGMTVRGAGTEDEAIPLAPTTYADYTPSGEAAWWMEIAHDTVTVGTTKYTQWRNIWPKASKLLDRVGDALDPHHPMGHIRSLELTYEDMFVWSGKDESYAPEQVVQTSWIPGKAKPSKEWHTGQGWVDDPMGERILERFQVSGVMMQADGMLRPSVAIQTTAVLGFGGKTRIMDLQGSFKPIYSMEAGKPRGLEAGNGLHKRTSRILKELLNPKMARKISLAG